MKQATSKKLVRSRQRAKQASLVACFVRVSYMAYFSSLKMEMTCFSETSIDFNRIHLNLIINRFYCDCLCDQKRSGV
jgi:hypothetical protein